MKRFLLITGGVLIFFAVLLFAAQAVAARTGGYDLLWNTMFSGGATNGGAYMMDSAIGQPFAGKTGNSPYELCAGYLCGMQVERRAERRVYLPLMRK